MGTYDYKCTGFPAGPPVAPIPGTRDLVRHLRCPPPEG